VTGRAIDSVVVIERREDEVHSKPEATFAALLLAAGSPAAGGLRGCDS